MEEPEMHHDDLLGEAVCPEEADVVQQTIMMLTLGRQQQHERPYFPGSQPVSLARSNLEYLRAHRYPPFSEAAGPHQAGSCQDPAAISAPRACLCGAAFQSSILADEACHDCMYAGDMEGGWHAIPGAAVQVGGVPH